jgi:hypothetical protein
VDKDRDGENLPTKVLISSHIYSTPKPMLFSSVKSTWKKAMFPEKRLRHEFAFWLCYFSFLMWYWSLNLGLCDWKVGALLLEPHFQPWLCYLISYGILNNSLIFRDISTTKSLIS